jgi:hypothetical protein
MGVSPSEFWKMRPRHFWYLVADKAAQADKLKPNAITGKDAKRLRKMMDAHNLMVQKERAANG